MNLFKGLYSNEFFSLFNKKNNFIITEIYRQAIEGDIFIKSHYVTIQFNCYYVSTRVNILLNIIHNFNNNKKINMIIRLNV